MALLLITNIISEQVLGNNHLVTPPYISHVVSKKKSLIITDIKMIDSYSCISSIGFFTLSITFLAVLPRLLKVEVIL